MTTRIEGIRVWDGSRDAEGWRTFTVTHLIKAESTDGPYRVMNTSGLPLPGTFWNFGGDQDVWSWCRPDMEVKPHDHKEGDPTVYWTVTQTFSNKPDESATKRCQDTQTENPLLEPAKVSGSLTKTQVEAVYDRFGRPIVTSSWELIRGPLNEWDNNRPSIEIEQNVATLDGYLLESMIDTVNSAILWGRPRRTVKFSNYSWDKIWYGQCAYYYKRKLRFDINYETWDRDLLDEGTKVLNGKWNTTTREWELININGAAPDKNNPNHFIRFTDFNANLARVILDGNGEPYAPQPTPLTMACDQCSAGSPTKWVIYGFIGLNNSTAAVTLNHSSACTWVAALPEWNGRQITLEYNLGDDQWVLTSNVIQNALGVDTVWVQSNDNWNCRSSNTMTLDINPNGDAPQELILLPFELTSPGRRHVEKYRESNMLLLKIPTTF